MKWSMLANFSLMRLLQLALDGQKWIKPIPLGSATGDTYLSTVAHVGSLICRRQCCLNVSFQGCHCVFLQKHLHLSSVTLHVASRGPDADLHQCSQLKSCAEAVSCLPVTKVSHCGDRQSCLARLLPVFLLAAQPGSVCKEGWKQCPWQPLYVGYCSISHWTISSSLLADST